MDEDDLEGVSNFIAIIIVVIIVIISVIVSLFLDKTLTIKNKEKTSGVIVDIVNIKYYSYRMGILSYYKGTIVVEYEVDGHKYYTTKNVKAKGKFNTPNTDNTYCIGDKKTVVYNKELPTKSAVDEIELYEIAIYIIFIIEILVLIVLIYKRVTRKKKLCLKVVAIENIDYQRERVFFEEKLSKKIFFIDYDLGEEIKIGEEYQLNNTYKNNYKKQTVLLKNNNVEAYSIVNIDKDNFFKINDE